MTTHEENGASRRVNWASRVPGGWKKQRVPAGGLRIQKR